MCRIFLLTAEKKWPRLEMNHPGPEGLQGVSGRVGCEGGCTIFVIGLVAGVPMVVGHLGGSPEGFHTSSLPLLVALFINTVCARQALLTYPVGSRAHSEVSKHQARGQWGDLACRWTDSLWLIPLAWGLRGVLYCGASYMPCSTQTVLVRDS